MPFLYAYSGYGLNFESEIACPWFAPATGAADARIRLGDVPASLDLPTCRGLTHEADSHRILLTYPGIARFLVENGSEITVAQFSEASADSVTVFLSTLALGALLLQRGTLVLHAAACASAKGSILLAGYSGRGKSTVLAAMLARDYALLADDVSAVSLAASGRPVVHPSFSRLKLFADSADRIGIDCRELRQIRPNVGKYSVPADRSFLVTPQPITAVYILEYGTAPHIEVLPLSGQERLAGIREQVYCRRLAEGLRLQALHFGVAAALASIVPVVIVRRPRGLALVDDVADAIDRHLN